MITKGFKISIYKNSRLFARKQLELCKAHLYIVGVNAKRAHLKNYQFKIIRITIADVKTTARKYSPRIP